MRTIHSLSENFSDGLLFPKGTSAERGNPEAGYFRYNTETKGIEVYDGTSWSSMDNTPSYVTDGLVLNLDAGNLNSYDGSGVTWSDLAQDGNDGTINGATYTSNNSFDFDGSNDHINLTSHSSEFDFGTGNFSAEAWVKGSVNGDFRCIFWHHYDPGFTLITTYGQSPNGAVRFWLGGTVVNGNTSILDNTWHHVIVTRDGATVTIYVDGAQDASSSAFSGKSATTTIAQAAIGQYNVSYTSYPFDGEISVVRIYEKTLTAEEALINFNATKTRFGL